MLRLCFFSLMLMLMSQPAFAKRIALVIGNDAYANLPVHYQLQKARNDARVTAETFKKLGFEVIKGFDLNRRDMNVRLAKFVNQIEPGDEVFFFFAGHGVQIDGQNYLLPSDIPSIESASEDLIKFESIRVDQISNRMRRKGARLSILVIDACRNNPYESTKGRSIGGTRGLASMEPPEGTLVLFSAGAGQAALDRLSDDDVHPNSIFTRTFLPLVQRKGLELSQLARQLKSEVRGLARTVGHTQTPAVYNEVIGNVYLSGKGEARSAKKVTKLPSLSTGAEETLWQVIKNSKKISDYEFYLKEYPGGRYSSVAKLIVRNLKSKQEQDVAVGVFPKNKDRNSVEKSKGTLSRGWHQQAGDLANHRYSPLNQINTKNVHKLKLAWNASTGVLRGHEGSPLVVNDLMYIHTPFPNNVFALDVKTGVTKWSYKPRIDPTVITMMCCDTVNRGLAYGGGKIFLYQADATLVALDARTGKVQWKSKNGNYKLAELGHGAPLIVKDKVLVGIRGDEFGVRGHITAYSLHNGRRLWRAYSMGPDKDIKFDPRRTTHLGKPVGRQSGVKSWKGNQWKIGGGTTWGWFSYDPDLNLVYYGTSNPGTWNSSQRPGDNRWSNSIIARDVDTGMARWVYQLTPHDQWHYDGTGEMILSDLTIKGQQRKALVHFDSNGFAYTLDRVSGELLLAEKFNPHVNWASHIDLKTGRPALISKYAPGENGEDVNTKEICPTSAGAKNSQPAAFSPQTNLFYVPSANMCMDFEPFKVSYAPGQPYVGSVMSMYPPVGDAHMGEFLAFDATKGKIIWFNKHQFPVWSGALATAGGVVFYGTMKGELIAVDAKDGRQLFKYPTSSGIVGNVMTFAYQGKQYVAVYSGVGSWAGIGLAAGLTNPSSGLGMVGAMAALGQYTRLGGQVVVLALP